MNGDIPESESVIRCNLGHGDVNETAKRPQNDPSYTRANLSPRTGSLFSLLFHSEERRLSHRVAAFNGGDRTFLSFFFPLFFFFFYRNDKPYRVVFSGGGTVEDGPTRAIPSNAVFSLLTLRLSRSFQTRKNAEYSLFRR